jgi:hypothetical protein
MKSEFPKATILRLSSVVENNSDDCAVETVASPRTR